MKIIAEYTGNNENLVKYEDYEIDIKGNDTIIVRVSDFPIIVYNNIVEFLQDWTNINVK